jgi:hypothetical protein
MVVMVGGAMLFYLLRGWSVQGGDTGIFTDSYRQDRLRQEYWDGPWIYRNRQPLCYLAVQGVHRLVTHDVEKSFFLVDSVCGGIFLALLLGRTRHAGFLAVNLVSAMTLQFVGHMELYAPAVVTIYWYLIELMKAMEGGQERGPVRPAVALAVAGLFHKVALVFAPALVWVLVERREGRLRLRQWPTWQWAVALGCLVLPFAIDTVGWTLHLTTDWLRVRTEDDSLLKLLTPLTPRMAQAIAAAYSDGHFCYTLGTWKHWSYFLGFVLEGAPLGLLVLPIFWRRLRGGSAWALATATLLGLVWMFLWHPHRGRGDWDLFVLGVIPLNLLVGALWAGLAGGEPAKAAELGRAQY